MNRFQLIFIIILVFCTMGAGPCDVLNSDGDDDGDETTSGECATIATTCEHSLEIDVLLAGGDEYPAGMYTFELTAPDSSVYTIDCYTARADAGMDCSGENSDVLISWIDPQDYSLIHFHVNGAPHSCTVRIFYDDYQLIEKYLEPDYELSYPNGDGCDPVCYDGEAQVAVAIY